MKGKDDYHEISFDGWFDAAHRDSVGTWLRKARDGPYRQGDRGDEIERASAGRRNRRLCAGKGPARSGNDGDSGRFAITTFASEDGAVPGKHKVVVSDLDKGPPGTKVDEEAKAATRPTS